MKGVRRPGKYIFTNKKKSPRALMSISLGLISSVSCLLSFYFTFLRGGEAPIRYGTVIILSLFFGLTGLILGIRSRQEEDTVYLLSYLGMVLNTATLMMCSLVLYYGVM